VLYRYAPDRNEPRWSWTSPGVVVAAVLWGARLAIILGAELNCELERQTAGDATTGDARPLGDRDAYAADTLGAASDTHSKA
jgi:membrane protein